MTLKTPSELQDLGWFHLIAFHYFKNEEIPIWVATGTLQ